MKFKKSGSVSYLCQQQKSWEDIGRPKVRDWYCKDSRDTLYDTVGLEYAGGGVDRRP